MAKEEKKFEKNRNPRNNSSIDWSQYDLEEIARHVGTATEIPETEVEWEGCNPIEGQPDQWVKYTTTEKGTKAMQCYYNTDYTYAQARDYIEKSGYRIKMMTVEDGYESYVVKVAKQESAEAKSIDLNELFNTKPSHKKTTLNVKPESKDLLAKICEGYPWGVRGAAEAEIIGRALEMYAKANRFRD